MGVGERIKEERLRLGLTQTGLVDQVGSTVQSLRSYESERSKPDAAYLQELSRVGMDVYYVLVGRKEDEPSRVMLEPDERALVKGYQSLNDESKSHLLGVLDALALKAVNKGENKSVRKKPTE